MKHLPATGSVRLTQTISDPSASTEKNLQTTENKTVPDSPAAGEKSAKQERDLSNETDNMYGRILAPATLRVRRYRQRHPRIDYYPAPDVLAIIKHHQTVVNEPCIAGIIDGLIRVGHRYVSKNERKKS